ncbi:toll/interleukin-1 receptor domain-containing protein [Pareuzebyella sediminis]|uniref:toll/interleukin-1 receptor domain-containing protein n=1 Tax=Pareuzebyella sediminis TaxID=2607998 RepID=UPI0011EEFBAE|nr:toll/interleukin-1 receptor domain-containing protein [Pareuzebyella sediminis]
MQHNAKPAIYISYAWGSESENIAGDIEMEFEKRGLPIIRDKKHLGYKGRIKDFMRQIGRAQYIILVISDKYLHSVNCMFELVQIFKNEHFYDRIFPVVLDEVNIADPSERIKLMKYWERETESLSNEIKQLKDLSNIQGLTDDLNLNSEIRNNIARLTDILKDTNTLSIAQLKLSNFEQLYGAVRERIESEVQNETPAVEKNDELESDELNGHSDNIFVKIKAKLFGTTAFFEVANKNRRRVISFGITAILGVCAFFLVLPFLRNSSKALDENMEAPSVPKNESAVEEDTLKVFQKESSRDSVSHNKDKEIEMEAPLSNVIYDVELVVPSDMAQAYVFVDGKPAEIIERGLISITVRLHKKESSHHFEIKDGDQNCQTDKLIADNNTRLTLCN